MKKEGTVAVVASTKFYTLEYLRGLAVLGIMLFHFISIYPWDEAGHTAGASTVLMRCGAYSVPVFYILSGLTLYLVYFERMKPSLSDLKDFYLKRFFRLLPLTWLVVVIALLIKHENPGWKQLVLNLTGLFAIIHRPGLAQEQWSIGNQLAFYLFFPVFVLLAKRSKTLFYLLSIVLLGAYIYFCFYVLTPNGDLTHEWTNCINPLNQVFLFLSGFMLGFFFSKINMPKSAVVALLLVGLVLFIIYPTGSGDEILLFTRVNRLVFTAISIIICFVFYKNTFKLPPALNWFFTFLGEASYTIYLFHPIIWHLKLFNNLSLVTRDIICGLLSIVISFIVYGTYQVYFMNLGRRISRKYIKQPEATEEQQILEMTAV